MAWLGIKGHSGSVDRRMSKDLVPLGDVCFSSLKSVLWFTVPLNSGPPTVVAHSVPDKWAFSEQAFLREGKPWPY